MRLRIRAVDVQTFGLVAIFILSGSPGLSAPCGGHGTDKTMLVSTEWLQKHAADRDLVVLAVGNKNEYGEGHIPGAQYLDYAQLRQSPSAGAGELILELPEAKRVAEIFEPLGVSNNSRIVLYQTKDWTTQTARVYLTLDAMGLGASTSILDGGFPAWRGEGRPVSRDIPAVEKGALQLCKQGDVIADLDYVRSNLHQPNTMIVDARLPEFYSGEKIPQDRRAGHIPGSVNVPFSALVDQNGRLQPVEAMRETFRKAGVQPGDRVVSYCHIGQQASLVYFVARYLGHDARMYDGSWQEWSAHAELPAETSAGSAPK